MLNLQKCAVIGCGNVGATCAYTLMHSGILSEIVLLDANAKKAEGEAMDLNHALPFLSPMRIYAGTYEDLADCGIIIIAAGAGQAKGETRIDLLKKNRAIMQAILAGIKPVNTDAILLLVSNPVDILTYIALDISGFDPHRVIGSGTVLDTARLKFLVGRMLQVDSRNVHTFIIGEHVRMSPASTSTASAKSAASPTIRVSLTACLRKFAPVHTKLSKTKAQPTMPSPKLCCAL